MNLNSVPFSLKPRLTNTKNIIYKEHRFPIDYDLLKRNSLFIQANDSLFHYQDNISLFDEEINTIEFPIPIIQDFINCCQNKEIDLNLSNLFYLHYLAQKYQVPELENATQNMIASNQGQLALESLFFLLTLRTNQQSFVPNTVKEEETIGDNFDQFMTNKKIFQLPLCILYRIVERHHSKISHQKQLPNSTQKDHQKLNAFLLQLFDVHRKRASVFLAFFDVNLIDDLMKLQSFYSDCIDSRYFNSTLFDTTLDLIRDMSAMKQAFSQNMAEMKDMYSKQKGELLDLTAKLQQKVQMNNQTLIDQNNQLKRELEVLKKEVKSQAAKTEHFVLEQLSQMKACVSIDPNTKKDIPLDENFTIPYDAYVMIYSHETKYSLYLNNILIYDNGSPAVSQSFFCKQNDYIALYINSSHRYNFDCKAHYYRLK